LNAQVLGISVDHIPCIKAWAQSLGGINYPLLSDFWPHGAIAQRYGVFRQSEGKSERAIFVVDKNGIIRYIDIHDIDTQPDNEEVRRVLREIDPQAAAILASRQSQTRVVEPLPLPQEGIVLYCTPWCPGCRKARQWLAERNLGYTYIDITNTPGAAQQVMSWANGNRTTPTIFIDGTVIVDWNEVAMSAALKDKGYLS
jgi:glutaredoxin